MVRLIKRYGSRKLYDTEESRYVSLEEIAVWVREGQQVRVVDKTTGDDVTSLTLTQVIAEEGRRHADFPPSEILHALIRRGEELVSTGVEQLSHGVDRLLRAGADRVTPLREVREETQLLRRRLDELEASLSDLETKGETVEAELVVEHAGSDVSRTRLETIGSEGGIES